MVLLTKALNLALLKLDSLKVKDVYSVVLSHEVTSNKKSPNVHYVIEAKTRKDTYNVMVLLSKVDGIKIDLWVNKLAKPEAAKAESFKQDCLIYSEN